MLKKKVRVLALSGRKISDSDVIDVDKRISAAWLGGNLFSTFPSFLLSCSKITIIDLSHNALSELPDLSPLSHCLERLFLQCNQLKSVPSSLLKCELLTQLDLSENPGLMKLAQKQCFSRVDVRKCIEQLNAPSRRVVALHLHNPDDLVSLVAASKGKWPENERVAEVDMTGEDWNVDSLYDCLYDQLRLRRKNAQLVCPLDLKPLSVMSESVALMFVGPRLEVCKCMYGAHQCRVHHSELALAAALLSSDAMNRELLNGSLNPEYVFANGQTLLEFVISTGRGRSETTRQVELLLTFGARCTLRSLSDASDRPELLALLQARVPEEEEEEWAQLAGMQGEMQDFAVEQRLGRKLDDTFSGVCSQVFLARFKGQSRCVIKVQNAVQGKSEVRNTLLQEQFAMEVEAFKKLSHPNILKLVHHFRAAVALPGIDSSQLSTVLVFPLVERNLSRQIKFRKLRARPPFWSNWEFSVIARELLEAVGYMQRNGICHRDLKQDNILVRSLYGRRRSSHVLVCDFGLSAIFSGPDMTLPFSDKGFGVGGAHAFLPPEIALATPGRGTVLDFSKSDNWGAGKVLYAMLSREKPFDKAGPVTDACYRPLIHAATPICNLLRGLLQCDPNARLDVAEALKIANTIPLDQTEVA